MAEPIPLNQPPKDVVLALINRDNNTTFTLSQVDLTTITVMPSNFARNTSIKIVDVPGGGYTDSEETVYYNRLDLGVQWSNVTAVALVDNPLSTHDLLESINTIYGIHLTPDDVENLPYTGNPHTVVAKPGSFVWIGQKAFNVLPTNKVTTLTLDEEFEDMTDIGFVYSPAADYDDTPINLMYKMLTEFNASALPYNPGHFTISAPVPVVGNDAQVTLTAVNGSGLTGSKNIVYHRIPLGSLLDNLQISTGYFVNLGYTPGQTVSAADLLMYVNETFGLSLSSSHISFTTAVLNDTETFTATASGTNYLANGSVVFTFVEEVIPEPTDNGILNFDGANLTGYDGSTIVGFDVII